VPRELFKTVILFEVLHEGIIPSDMDLGDIVRETAGRSYSGSWASNSIRLTPQGMAAELEEQGSDPAFILGEDWNKGEDDE
tara:strand:- start:197 stop:439 length:243 start_codon:yes stop_codon:yes gene_type:complete